MIMLFTSPIPLRSVIKVKSVPMNSLQQTQVIKVSNSTAVQSMYGSELHSSAHMAPEHMDTHIPSLKTTMESNVKSANYMEKKTLL